VQFGKGIEVSGFGVAELQLLSARVGEGAPRFAKMHGFKEEELLTDRSRMAWLTWKREMRDRNGHTNWNRESTLRRKDRGDEAIVSRRERRTDRVGI